MPRQAAFEFQVGVHPVLMGALTADVVEVLIHDHWRKSRTFGVRCRHAAVSARFAAIVAVAENHDSLAKDAAVLVARSHEGAEECFVHVVIVFWFTKAKLDCGFAKMCHRRKKRQNILNRRAICGRKPLHMRLSRWLMKNEKKRGDTSMPPPVFLQSFNVAPLLLMPLMLKVLDDRRGTVVALKDGRRLDRRYAAAPEAAQHGLDKERERAAPPRLRTDGRQEYLGFSRVATLEPDVAQVQEP